MAEEAIDFRPLEVVFSVPGMNQVQRQRDLTYKSLPSGTLLMDIYHPPPPARQPLPAVVFVHGDGPADWLKDIKDWGQYVSWGRLVAASGLAVGRPNTASIPAGWPCGLPPRAASLGHGPRSITGRQSDASRSITD